MEFMELLYDDKRGEAHQVISIKEVSEGSLDDLKENEVCMLVFDIIEWCHMVVGNMLYLESMIKRKDLHLWKDERIHGSHIA